MRWEKVDFVYGNGEPLHGFETSLLTLQGGVSRLIVWDTQTVSEAVEALEEYTSNGNALGLVMDSLVECTPVSHEEALNRTMVPVPRIYPVSYAAPERLPDSRI